MVGLRGQGRPAGAGEPEGLGNAGAWRLAPAGPWVVEDVQMGMRNIRDQWDPEKQEPSPPQEEIVDGEKHDQTCLSGRSQGSHGLASQPQQPLCCLLLHSPWTSGFKRTFCADCI